MKSKPKYEVGSKYAMPVVSHIKIMAYSDGYYMCRYKGCSPFILTQKELTQALKPTFQ